MKSVLTGPRQKVTRRKNTRLKRVTIRCIAAMLHNVTLYKIYDVPMKFVNKLIHGGQCNFVIDLFHTVKKKNKKINNRGQNL